MLNLWNEISDIADFDKVAASFPILSSSLLTPDGSEVLLLQAAYSYPFQNGEVDTEEFTGGVRTACKGKKYTELPEAFKFFIEVGDASVPDLYHDDVLRHSSGLLMWMEMALSVRDVIVLGLKWSWE